MGVREEFASGAFWSIAQKWGARVSSLATVVVLARSLDPADFGVVAVALAFTGFLAVFVDFGAASYIGIVDELTDELLNSVFWVSVGLGALITGGVFVAAPLVASLLELPELTLVLRLLSLGLLVTALSGVQNMLLRRALRFKALAARFLISNFVAAVVAVALALSGAGVFALVAQQLTASLVGLLLLWRTSTWRPGRRVSRTASRSAFTFGLKVTGTNVTGQIEGQGLTLLIGGVLGVTALGYFSIASKLTGIFLDLFVFSLGAAAGPIFAKYKHLPDVLTKAFLKALDLTSVVGASALALLSATSVIVVPLAFGDQWEGATAVAAVLGAGAVVNCFTYFNRSLLVARRQEALVLKIAVFDTIAVLVLCTLALPYGLVVVALTKVFVILLTAALLSVAVVRHAAVPAGALVRTYLRNGAIAGLVAASSFGVMTLMLGNSQPRLSALTAAVLTSLAVALGAAAAVRSPVISELRRVIDMARGRRRAVV